MMGRMGDTVQGEYDGERERRKRKREDEQGE
jgi:hypothetical protein